MTEQPMLPGMEPDDETSSEELREELHREFKQYGRTVRYAELEDQWRAARSREKRDQILGYDPNSDEDNMPQFASYCPSRSGASFKMHTRWHHATRAVKMHDGAVYKWNDHSATWVRWEVWFNEEYLGR